jgi:hypothetical protein
VTLVLGAGVSASVGLPSWNQLLVRICQTFIGHWRFHILQGSARTDRPPKALSIAGLDLWDDEEVLKLGAELAQGNQLLAAQQIKNCIRDLDWAYLLRKCLYEEADSKKLTDSPLIKELAAVVSKMGQVNAILNYNYDSLFEDYLEKAGVRFTAVCDEGQRIRRGSLPIYHVHGYLKRGGGPKTRIILAEDDYHEDLVAPYSWSNMLQSSLLTRSTCIFVGTSMTDPNLRRLLRSAFKVGRRFHYAIMPCNAKSEVSTMRNALFDRDLHSLGVAAIRYPLLTRGNKHSRLVQLIKYLSSGI